MQVVYSPTGIVRHTTTDQLVVIIHMVNVLTMLTINVSLPLNIVRNRCRSITTALLNHCGGWPGFHFINNIIYELYTVLYAYPFHLEAWLELDTIYIKYILHHVYYDVHIYPSHIICDKWVACYFISLIASSVPSRLKWLTDVKRDTDIHTSFSTNVSHHYL